MSHFAFGSNAPVEQLQHPAHQRRAKAVALLGARTVPLIELVKHAAKRLGIQLQFFSSSLSLNPATQSQSWAHTS